MGSGVTAVAVGEAHTCAIKTVSNTSTSTRCWGDNYYGQSGKNRNFYYSTGLNIFADTSPVLNK